MASINPHVGDVGTAFEVTIKDQDGAVVNLAGASALVMTFQKPDGTSSNKPAQLSSTGADGKMKYVTITGDLDQNGTWAIQGHVTLSDGDWHSDVHKQRVDANI